MTRHQEFSALLRKIQCSSRCSQYTALRDVAVALEEENKNDLQELLELLISTHDIEIQTKLLSVLAAYIINNGINYDMIVKYNPLYDTIQNLLVGGLPMKAAVVLNFVMALLTGDDARNLGMHARNMIRVSGCLNTMSDIFSGSMMYQDTWIALCQSLAEACRGSEVNQNYCSHLVPLCVQRCRQGNVDVCTVLQSLLFRHERNLQLFISSEGLTIFTRQLLQYNISMQLLNTIVEKSSVAVSMLQATDIVHHLRDFLHLYGPYSQMGQWSTIILYHLDKKENSILETSNRPQLENVRVDKVTAHECSVRKIIKNLSKPTDDFPNINENAYDQRSKAKDIRKNTTSRTEHIFRNDINPMPKQDDTVNLFQNVIKEVIYWKSKENRPSTTQINFNSAKDLPRDPVQIKRHETIYKNNIKQNMQGKPHEKDLTFSFLMKETSQDPTKQNRNDKIIDSFLTPSTYTGCNVTSYDKGVQTNNSNLYNTGYHDETNINLQNFRPAFISTPKRNKTPRSNVSKITYKSKASTTHSRKQIKRASRLKCLDDSKAKQQSPVTNKQIKHRSMSERFFNAINESCTTIVKSMKNIFRSKPIKDDDNDTTSEANENGSCSYSFTNYMRKRDALLEGDSQHDDSSSGIYKVDSCKTCRDTIILQQKMKRDDQLKQTVRKLKVGINLYGCDFKKISHAMWPRDRYMTPEVLYNLYRKLIIKGGHDNHSFRQKAHYAIRRR